MRNTRLLGRIAGRWGFARAKGGNVAILVALSSTMIMGAAAVGIDLGVAVHMKRKAQGAADVAAMLAAVDIANAAPLARRSLADNGFGTAAATVNLGTYDSTAAIGARYTDGGGAGNAVRVKLTTTAPATFVRFVGLPGSVPITVTATAATAQFAAFTVGSGIAAVDGGIANAVLGSLLGVKLSLRAVDYDALAGVRIDGLRVLDALGASLGLQNAGYTRILASNASIGQIVMALRVGAQGNSTAVAALTSILNAMPNPGNLVPLTQLDALADAVSVAPGPGLPGPSEPLMSVLSAAASIANGQNQIALDLGVAVPGLLSTKLTLAIGERKRSSGWVRPGTANATVRTAQTRLLLETTLAAPLGLGQLNLPLFVSAAPAKGTLRSLTCGSSGRQVVIDGQTGLATLAIAEIPRSAINTGDLGPDLSKPATLLALPLLQVTGRSQLVLGTNTQSLTFNEADIAAFRVRSIASGAIAQSLTSSLLGNLVLSLNGLGLTPLLQPALSATLLATAPALDLVLGSVMKVLGLRLGYADYGIDGTLCGQAVLVQ
ncbi:TadG family pilus assembly protein [Methylobacterium sp. NFXW15]|uniref:TadG family pilus assembly protein n=1 Tax=Methylobacterium sp. NFXW15 TaxID=2819512 RepID=UPI003CF847FA